MILNNKWKPQAFQARGGKQGVRNLQIQYSLLWGGGIKIIIIKKKAKSSSKHILEFVFNPGSKLHILKRMQTMLYSEGSEGVHDSQ